ncbi:MAG: VOC family protein [Rhodobiaceae bacterium]|nr:VOC family protein [Rhodobiaceae bacterium]
MHHSRLGVIVIDCQTDDLSEGLTFWTGALGVEGEIDDDGKYAVLDMPGDGPRVLLQAVDHESRVHLDIESDDKDAEVDRLTALGAKVVARVKRWIVMEAPTGQRFCVVNPQTADFPARGKTWGGDR